MANEIMCDCCGETFEEDQLRRFGKQMICDDCLRHEGIPYDVERPEKEGYEIWEAEEIRRRYGG